MKKMIKGFCIAAVVLICLGMIFCIGGMAAGGAMTATGIMKDILNRHGMFYSAVYTIGPETEGKKSGTFGSEFGADDVKNLVIKTGAAEVEISAGSRDDVIKVSAVGRKVDVKLEQGDTLVIRDHYSVVGVHTDEKIQVEIPDGFQFKQTEISAGAGSLLVTSLHTDSFELEVGAGAAEISGLTAEEAEFDIGVGEITVYDGNIRQCDLDIGMGHFEYDGIIYDGISKASCDVDCGMGDAEFRLKGSPQDYDYKIDCSAGTVEIDGERYSGLEHKNHISHHAESTFDIDCSMGKVTIEFEGGHTNEKIDEVL